MQFICASIFVRSLNESTWGKRSGDFKKWGWSEDDVAAFVKQPNLYDILWAWYVFYSGHDHQQVWFWSFWCCPKATVLGISTCATGERTSYEERDLQDVVGVQINNLWKRLHCVLRRLLLNYLSYIRRIETEFSVTSRGIKL